MTVSKTTTPKTRAPDAKPLATAQDRALLLKWSKSRTGAARVVMRSRIVLMLVDGISVKAISETLRVASSTIRLWRRRYNEFGPAGLLTDAPGRGRKPALDATKRAALSLAAAAGDRRSVREHARELGVSAATVSRWRRRR